MSFSAPSLPPRSQVDAQGAPSAPAEQGGGLLDGSCCEDGGPAGSWLLGVVGRGVGLWVGRLR